MAELTAGEELFVNSKWTDARKVPKRSPYGVELVYGENAFRTLAEAIAYAKAQSLADVRCIDGDKIVTITSTDGEVARIAAEEIKGTETVKAGKTGTTYTARSKQSTANRIASAGTSRSVILMASKGEEMDFSFSNCTTVSGKFSPTENTAFAAGDEYQLRLTAAADTGAFSYSFGVKGLS
jgi:hypothetical protein